VKVTGHARNRVIERVAYERLQGVMKAVFTAALWGEPALTMMLVGAPGLLVRLKLAGAALRSWPSHVTFPKSHWR